MAGAGYLCVMQERKMTNIKDIVYISQIDTRDIFAYPHHAAPILQWLTDNGYDVVSWEAFLETKKEIARTLSFGRKTDSPYRNRGEDVTKIKKEIELSIEDWSKTAKQSRLIICLNLKSALKPRNKHIPLWGRIAAGILGVSCFGILGMISYALVVDPLFVDGLGWFGLISVLICTPLFLYAVFTGKGDLDFLSPENYFKKRTKQRVITETGQLRWPKETKEIA